MSFLGHVVSEQGVETESQKVEAVKDWPVSTDKTQVRAILGLCSYYRRFVKNCADVAKPLHKLAEEKRHFCWNESCDSAFRKLKNFLCNTPILGYPNTENDFIVDTDTNNTRIGGVLTQQKANQEVVIAYFSK